MGGCCEEQRWWRPSDGVSGAVAADGGGPEEGFWHLKSGSGHPDGQAGMRLCRGGLGRAGSADPSVSSRELAAGGSAPLARAGWRVCKWLLELPSRTTQRRAWSEAEFIYRHCQAGEWLWAPCAILVPIATCSSSEEKTKRRKQTLLKKKKLLPGPVTVISQAPPPPRSGHSLSPQGFPPRQYPPEDVV